MVPSIRLLDFEQAAMGSDAAQANAVYCYLWDYTSPAVSAVLLLLK